MTTVHLLCLALLCGVAMGNLQSVGIKGRLMCGDKPDKKVEVKLVDVDTGIDDTLASGETDRYGEFQLAGSTSELTNIDPYLKIYTDCNDGMTLCQRKWKLKIPDKYITQDRSTPREIMDLGTINTEIEMMDEEHDCIH